MSFVELLVKRVKDPSGDDIVMHNAGTEEAPKAVQTVALFADWTEYGTNDVEEASATVTYVGKEKADGTWLLMKIDTTTGTVIRYASQVNNALVTDYASAWADRASLVYETFAEAV